MLKKAGWLDCYSYKNSVAILKELALIHAVKAGPYSAPLVELIEGERWSELLDFELHYTYDDNPDELKHARQALGFFEKFEPLRLSGESKTYRAFKKFAETENVCSKVNDRFCSYRSGTPMGYPFDVILTDARIKIERILGDLPPLSQMDFSYGPGATVNTQKRDACFRVKLGVQPECSSELWPFLRTFLQELPTYVLHHASNVPRPQEGSAYHEFLGDDNPFVASVDVDVVPGRLQFVPKDAKKFRTITVEPGLNTLLQQGIGKSIRKRLRKAGVDLDNGKLRNLELARVSSLTNHLATIDFSSASDTIATQMVAFLLPDKWYTLMSLARTGTVSYEGLHIKLEKFSTMGNSFTFELESLIFYSLAWAVCKFVKQEVKDLAIFGDDLVIPVGAVPLAELVFAYCGFTINAGKSFVDGPFRESCGGDFHLGIDIRPYYQKHLVTAESLFTLHNFYVRSGNEQLARYVREAWIHPDLIIFGPDGYGDGHLIGDWTGVDKRIRLRIRGKDGRLTKSSFLPHQLGWDGTHFKSYRHVKATNYRHNHGDQLLPSFSIYMRDPQDIEEPQASSTPQGTLWADPKYFVTQGSRGYEVVLIYTLARDRLLP